METWEDYLNWQKADALATKAERKAELARQRKASKMVKEAAKIKRTIRDIERAEIAERKAYKKEVAESYKFLQQIIHTLPTLRPRPKDNVALYMRHALDSNKYMWAANHHDPVSLVAESLGVHRHRAAAIMLQHALKLVTRKLGVKDV